MRDPPDLEEGRVLCVLTEQFGLDFEGLGFLPLGYDPNAWIYEALTRDGRRYFLKLRAGEVNEAGLLVPGMLAEQGIRNVLAPLRSRSGAPWLCVEGHALVLYPFLEGESAMKAGLSDEQWRVFGSTLRAVHSASPGPELLRCVPTDRFGLPFSSVVRKIGALMEDGGFQGAAERDFAEFWKANDRTIARALELGERLAEHLRGKSFARVLCHSDIHGGNLLVGESGSVTLVDWDSPMFAPRERDLIFIVGSTIARTVTPREEELFFDGYGCEELDAGALLFYRLERGIEDLAAWGEAVLLAPGSSQEAKRAEVEFAKRCFWLDVLDEGYMARVERWCSPGSWPPGNTLMPRGR